MNRFQIVLLSLCLTAAAADKNGVSPNSISLPKGPGSIEGLGDSFQPTLNTGTAKYGIGLKLPPGTAGHQPSLALAYEGGGGNGPLGYGWTIHLPHIQRQTDDGIPTYGESLGVDRPDTFVNDSREVLVPTADGFFFCENEGAFIRYKQVADHWEGTLPDGTRLEFGLTAVARIEDPGTERTFRWLLERETDTRGNVIEYVYLSFPGGQNLNQKYLALVRYGPGSPPWTAFHFVAFEYEGRPDWFEDARAGFLVRTGQRLRSVHVATQGVPLTNHLAGDFNSDGTADYLNRRYDLEYLRYDGAASHWSLLAKVTLVGADGITSLPPATFGYAVSNPPDNVDASSNVWTSLNAPNAVMDNPLADLIDLNADGLPDVLKTEAGGGGHTVAINRGPIRQGDTWGIQWASPVSVDPGLGAAWNFDLASDQTHLADMDGDGLADLVHKTADESVFYFANRGRLSWGERRDMASSGSAPPAPFGDFRVRTADVDFDKRIDVIQSIDFGGTVGYRVWFNLGNQSYSSSITVEPEGGFDFGLAGVQVADCNGDRVADIARIQPGAVNVAAGLGYGRFAAPLSLVLPDITLDDQQIARAKLADINGDGLADLVLERAAPGQCWFWLNLGNYTLDSQRVITGLPALSANTSVRWADLNGNGTTDLIYADSTAASRLRMIELGQLLTGGLPPNLLTRIANGIGRVTSIDYAPSTQFALADDASGRPWPDAVPFPVTVVAAVTVSDSLGHEYVSRYRYHDGYYDPAEKQFRGFANVEQIDVGDPTSPTLVSRSQFDTGRGFDAMKGRLLRASAETEDGALFSCETNTWSNPPRTVRTGTNGVAIRFAHLVATAKDILEKGSGTPRRLESEMEYDDYGNQTRDSNYGIVESGDRSAFDDERIIVTEYALNLNDWIIRLPKRQFVQDENSVVISRSESFYDDETFSGNNLGVVTVGNLTLQREWANPAGSTDFVNTARTKYDSFGNPIALFDPLSDGMGDVAQGHFRELVYDANFHTYPVRETVHIGGGSPALVFEAAYDPGLTTVIRSLDFNSHTTTYGYDALGRLVRVVRPGDTEEYPTAEYDYVLALPVGVERVINYVETRQRDQSESQNPKSNMYLFSRQFTDGLGRSVMTRTEAEPAEGSAAPRVVVNGVTLFNARMKPARTLSPFFTTRAGTLTGLLDFEDVEAPGWQGQFAEGSGFAMLNLATAHQSSIEYDAMLRTIKTTNADGTFARAEYEPLVTRASDENDTDTDSPHFNTPMVNFADGLGRLIQVNELVRLNNDGTPSGALQTWTTRYRYDLNHRITRIADSQDNVKELRYDGLERKVWMNDPDTGISTNRYDVASNLIETTDAKGQRITYTYDGANRILAEDYHDENSTEFSYGRSPDIVFHYDAPRGPIDQGDGAQAVPRNAKGMLAWVEDTSGEVHTSYDARGRIEWSVKRIPDPLLSSSLQPQPSNLVSYKTAFAYDAMDRVTRMTYPDNDEVSYRYNARSFLRDITGGPTGHILSGVTYLPSAQQQRIEYGNGIRTTYAYDKRRRLTELSTLNPQPSTQLLHFTYDLDPVSNIRSITDERPESVVAANDPRRNTQHFHYDDLYRLTQVRYNAATPSPQPATNFINYRYDRIGNMLGQASDIDHLERGRSATDVGELSYGGAAGRHGRNGRQPNDPPGPHALTSVAHPSHAERHYPYDANGNMTEIDGLRCTWDFRDRLVAVEDDTMRADYRYDYTGRRVLKKVFWRQGEPTVAGQVPAANAQPSTTATTYIGKHFEIRDHDQPVKYVFNGGTRVAKITGSLSSNLRVQRLRLHAGWNLVSLAVTVNDARTQLFSGVVAAAYFWHSANGDYAEIATGQTLSAGSVLWIRANTSGVATLMGEYIEPSPRTIPAGPGFVPAWGFEASSLHLSTVLSAGYYDAANRRWRNGFAGDLAFMSDLPRTLAPGEAIFVQTDAPVELSIPEPGSRILYYHEDHLGSASAVTDANGTLVEETANYPFGIPRHEHRLRTLETHFSFTQKERDRESGLHYFEARYLGSALARFTAPDPKYANLDGMSSDELSACLAVPQMMNLYAYTANNPLKYTDPTGLELWIPIVDDWDELDVGQTLVNLTPGVGAMVSRVSNFAFDTDLDTRSLLGQFASEVSGSDAVGTAVETGVEIAVGAGGIRQALKGGWAILKNPGSFLKGTWGAVKQDVGLLIKPKPAAVNSAANKSAKSVVDPLAKTPAGPPPPAAPVSKRAATHASASGDAARAASSAAAYQEAQLKAYYEILEPFQATARAAVKAGAHPSQALDKAFKGADAVWRSKFGTTPPGSL